MDRKIPVFDRIIGITVIAGLVAGFIGLVAAMISLLYAQWMVAGIFLISAALVFGSLANALLRK